MAALIIALCAILQGALLAQAQEVEPLRVIKVADGAFVAQGAVETSNSANNGHIANLGFIAGSTYVAVIDTGGSFRIGQQLRAAIKATTDLPIKYVINTHMHPDHVLGNAAFLQDGAEFVGHVKLANALRARADTYLAANKQLVGADGFAGTRIVLPTRPIAEPVNLDLGDRVLQVIPVETAHTDNDVMIIDRKTRSAWLGDLVFTDHLPVIDGSINGWLELMGDLMQREFSFVVIGHGDVVAKWPQSAKPQLDYLSNLRQQVRSFIEDGQTMGTALNGIAPPAGGIWKLTGEFHRRNISAAFAELEWE